MLGEVHPTQRASSAVGLAGMAPDWRGRGATLALIVVASYTLNWAWTGFAGKQLWDWLHLMLFPVVVVLRSFHDWLDLMIAPFLVPLAARSVHAYHTSPRASKAAVSR